MDSTRTRLLLATALLVSAAACRDAARDVGWRGMPIFGGTPDTDPAHDAVVAVIVGDSYLCSGTLIRPDVVLTAAHCLQETTPASTHVYFGEDINGTGDWFTVSDVHPHAGYIGDGDDIGLVRLVGSSTVAPIPTLPAGTALTVGMDLGFSGFGLTETDSSGVKLRVARPLGLVCDGPASCDLGGNHVVPRGIAYYTESGGPCTGDSGGPAFVDVGGVEYVAGVSSYGDSDCTVYGVSTLVSAYSTWIGEYVGDPVEICDVTGDEDGDGLEDCDDPDCATSPSCMPNACDDAPTIGCGDSVTGTTTGGPASFDGYSCLDGAEPGPEVAYRLTAVAGAEVSVTLDVAADDLDLFVLAAAGDTCDPGACIAASYEPAGTDEVVTFTMPATAYLVVETSGGAPAYTLTVSCGTTAEDCDNDADDDGDGAVDCADADCEGQAACQTANGDGDEAAGCGCRAAASTGGSPAAGALAVGLLLGLVRRRRT